MSTPRDAPGGLEEWLSRAGAAAADATENRLWQEGRPVGEWTVAGFVGRGGSAEVYCARHRRLGMQAVLKVLWRDGEGPRARFDRETRFLMESPGPSFPAFYGAGMEEDRPWMALELLEEYPLPTSDTAVAAYLLDVARGAEELHRRGWVHRDLKPRNILRRTDGHAVLIDFGLLKQTGEDAATETAAGRISPSVVDGREVGVGTPGYAAPEQFAGGTATPATDVHALGILADECFAGKPPRVWERIVRRATASLPRQRYVDAAALARAIRHRHWPRNAAWTALVFALALASAVWWWTSRMPAPVPAHSAPPVATPVQPPAPEPEAPSVSPMKTETRSEATGNGAGKPSVRAARAAALARFEADEGKKEIISGLLEDMEELDLVWEGMTPVYTWGGLHEVTQRQWTALMDDNPSLFPGDDLPVDSLTLGACLEFLERLNATSVAREEDRTFRLPSASEWETLAARYPSDTPEARREAGWFEENADGRTHPVGGKAEAGTCADLYGNVRELTRTWGNADGKEGFRCMGGSWADPVPGETLPVAVLEQPRFMRYWDRLPGADTVPSDYPHASCPAPGRIGFRLWAERRPSGVNDRLRELTKSAIEHWEREEGEYR